MAKEIRVGIVGLGFMGATHLGAYLSAIRAGFPARLVAVSDRNEQRRAGQVGAQGNLATNAAAAFDPAKVRGFADPAEMLRQSQLDLVSICTPTDTHGALATQAMESGAHVLVEKPVSLQLAEIQALEATSNRTGRFCMPAMCMRFWPAWKWLKDRVDDGQYGRCLSATFQRMGSAPAWSGFYADAARSGGALFDLHIHDADFVRFCFGDPVSVRSSGVERAGAVQHVATIYQFFGNRRPSLVSAEGGWLHAPFAFRMRFAVEFEYASADFDIGREPALLLHRDGTSTAVQVDPLTGYDLEIRHALECVAGSSRPTVGLGDAAETLHLLNRELESVRSATEIRL
jgi:predicted dehydrogenase